MASRPVVRAVSKAEASRTTEQQLIYDFASSLENCIWLQKHCLERLSSTPQQQEGTL